MNDQLNLIGDNTKCPVALIIRNNEILLGHRHYTTEKWKNISVWTCPGGRCDEGETIEQTLLREVKEETDIDDLAVQKYLGEFLGAKNGDFVPVFLCSSKQEARLMEPLKFSEWKWFAKADIPENFINKDVRELINDIL